MKKLEQLLNPLDIKYSIQLDLLMFSDKYISSENDENTIINALKEDGEVKIFSFSDLQLSLENELNTSIQQKLIKAKCIFMTIEINDEQNIDIYNKFIKYIYSFIGKDIIFNVNYIKVETPGLEPIIVLLTGYKNPDLFSVEFGKNLERFWIENQEYSHKKLLKTRKQLSKKLDQEIKSISMLGNRTIPNIVELIDVQTQESIRVFEFNASTIKEFKTLMKKLKISILDIISDSYLNKLSGREI